MQSSQLHQHEISIKVIDLIIINLSWWASCYLRFTSQILLSEPGLYELYFDNKHPCLHRVHCLCGIR